MFRENLECCIVPVYNIACVFVENQEYFVIPVNKSAVYYFVFYYSLLVENQSTYEDTLDHRMFNFIINLHWVATMYDAGKAIIFIFIF